MIGKQHAGMKKGTAAIKKMYPFKPKRKLKTEDTKYLTHYAPMSKLPYSGYNLAIYARMRKKPSPK